MYKVTLQFRNKAEADLWLNSLDSDHDTLGEIGENTYVVLLSEAIQEGQKRGDAINRKFEEMLREREAGND
jgi:hypothetical protein